MPKPILVLDYDGVCSQYTSGWQGVTLCPDEPVEGLWSFLESASIQFQLHIHSSRSQEEAGRRAMRRWFVQHGSQAGYHTSIGYERGEWVVFFADPIQDRLLFILYFPEHKPPAFLTLDDRALTFTGVWPTMATLRQFTPWYQHPDPLQDSEPTALDAARSQFAAGDATKEPQP